MDLVREPRGRKKAKGSRDIIVLDSMPQTHRCSKGANQGMIDSLPPPHQRLYIHSLIPSSHHPIVPSSHHLPSHSFLRSPLTRKLTPHSNSIASSSPPQSHPSASSFPPPPFPPQDPAHSSPTSPTAYPPPPHQAAGSCPPCLSPSPACPPPASASTASSLWRGRSGG